MPTPYIVVRHTDGRPSHALRARGARAAWVPIDPEVERAPWREHWTDRISEFVHKSAAEAAVSSYASLRGVETYVVPKGW